MNNLKGWKRVNLHVVPAGKHSNTSNMDTIGAGKNPKNPHVTYTVATLEH